MFSITQTLYGTYSAIATAAKHSPYDTQARIEIGCFSRNSCTSNHLRGKVRKKIDFLLLSLNGYTRNMVLRNVCAGMHICIAFAFADKCQKIQCWLKRKNYCFLELLFPCYIFISCSITIQKPLGRYLEKPCGRLACLPLFNSFF